MAHSRDFCFVLLLYIVVYLLYVNIMKSAACCGTNTHGVPDWFGLLTNNEIL